MLDIIRRYRKTIGLSLLAILLAIASGFELDKLRATTFNGTANQTKTKMITAALGGNIRLNSGNGVYDYYLSIPPDALSKSTQITMEVASESEAVINLFPEGLTFNTPVMLTMTIKPILMKSDIEGQTGIHNYNAAKETWDYQHGMTYETVDGNITSDTLLKTLSTQALGGKNAVQKWEYQDYDTK